MTPEAHIGRSQIADVAVICAVPMSDLEQLAVQLEALPLTIERKTIDGVIQEVLGASNSVAVSRFLFGVAIALRQERPTLDAILLSVSTAASGESAAERPELALWPDREEMVRRLFQIESIRLAAKAMDVSYDFERVYVTSRFLTTMRPIFNEERNEIRGAAVVQTLRLEFITASGDHTNISLALDWADIQQLKRACEDASKKAGATVEKARANWNLPTLMLGEADRE